MPNSVTESTKGVKSRQMVVVMQLDQQKILTQQRIVTQFFYKIDVLTGKLSIQ